MISGELMAPTVKGQYRRKDGSQLPVEAYPRAVRSREGHVIASIARDVSERLASEESLRRFRVAMDNSADMIVLIDRTTMRFVDVNETACRRLGYSREELLRMGPQDVLPVSREDLEHSYDELIANPAEADALARGMKSHYVCKDQSLLPFESTRHVLHSGDTTLIAAISRDIRSRRAIEEKVSYLAQFDALTGLPNRNLFQDRLTQAMALAKRNAWPMAVLFIDLDRFKLVNDTLGHGAGDKLLREAAERLRSCVRASDTVGRLGGDEFAAILSELTKPGDAGLVAQKIIDIFKRPFDLEGKETYVTASVGVTLYPADSDNAEALVVEGGLRVAGGGWPRRTRGVKPEAWREPGLTVPPISVNLSARQFEQKNLKGSVGQILGDTKVDPSLIEFEITESLLMNDPEGAARTLRDLKESGVKLSMDDFGTGYSSLGYLKRFPIDTLKIDRTFVRDISTDADDATLTRAIINLAQNLRLNVVAEGVETEAQLAFLCSNGCDEMQGYLFARPTTSEDCGRMLSEGRKLSIPRAGRKEKNGAPPKRARA